MGGRRREDLPYGLRLKHSLQLMKGEATSGLASQLLRLLKHVKDKSGASEAHGTAKNRFSGLVNGFELIPRQPK